MGIIGSPIAFMVGALCGAYVAQNYNIPDVRTLANYGFSMAKFLEENYRRRSADKDDDTRK